MKTKEIPKNKIFTNEEMDSLVALGEVLRKIRNRLIKEGHIIKDLETKTNLKQ